MNRPNKKDYEFSEQTLRTMLVDFKMPSYLQDLEKYCDELEETLEKIISFGKLNNLINEKFETNEEVIKCVDKNDYTLYCERYIDFQKRIISILQKYYEEAKEENEKYKKALDNSSNCVKGEKTYE